MVYPVGGALTGKPFPNKLLVYVSLLVCAVSNHVPLIGTAVGGGQLG